MGSGKLNDWIQAVGLFALVASLLFVGYQIKLTRDIAISQAYQARADTSANSFLEMSANDRIVSAMTKTRLGQADQLTPEEITSLDLNLSGALLIFENSYYQVEQGFLPVDHWDRVRATMSRAISNQPNITLVKRRAPRMRPGFREEFEGVIAEIEAERAAQ